MNARQVTAQAIHQVKFNNYTYYLQVVSFAENWFKLQMKSFTSEDFKNDFYKTGIGAANEPRVFGAVFRYFSKSGLIFKNGFVVSENKICHCRPQQVWISKEFKNKQQKNAVKNKNQISIF